MKNFTLLFMFIFLNNYVNAQWFFQNSGTNKVLNSVCFIDQNTGWIVGAEGMILKTTNGGTNWFNQTSGITKNLRNVSFLDLFNGIAVGDSGTILKTTNGGNNWLSITFQLTYYSLKAISFLNANAGVIVGSRAFFNGVYMVYYSVVLRTSNGGDNWLIISNPPYPSPIYLYDVFFIDVNNIIAVGYDESYNLWPPVGKIYRTTNSGSTWLTLTTTSPLAVSIL